MPGSTVATSQSKIGSAADQDTLVDQILAQAPSAEVALAMLMGSQLESGQNPSEAVMDTNGYISAGPFMINEAPGNGPWVAVGESEAASEDPQSAVAAMLPEYEGSAATVPSSLWQNNPTAAAEATVLGAERPANYNTSVAAIESGQGVQPYGDEGTANVTPAYDLAYQEYSGNVGNAPATATTSYTQLNPSGAGSGTGTAANTGNAPTSALGTALARIDDLLNGNNTISGSGIFTGLVGPLVEYGMRGGVVLLGIILIWQGTKVLSEASGGGQQSHTLGVAGLNLGTQVVRQRGQSARLPVQERIAQTNLQHAQLSAQRARAYQDIERQRILREQLSGPNRIQLEAQRGVTEGIRNEGTRMRGVTQRAVARSGTQTAEMTHYRPAVVRAAVYTAKTVPETRAVNKVATDAMKSWAKGRGA